MMMMKLAHIWYIQYYTTEKMRWGGYAAPQTTNVMAVTLALTLFSLYFLTSEEEEDEKKWTVTVEWQFFCLIKTQIHRWMKLCLGLAPLAPTPDIMPFENICTYLNPITHSHTTTNSTLSLTFHPSFCCYTRIDYDDRKKIGFKFTDCGECVTK